MKAFSNDFTGIGDKEKSTRLNRFDILSQKERLWTLHSAEDDIFFFVGERALCFKDCGAAVKLMDDKIADRGGGGTDDVKIFA